MWVVITWGSSPVLGASLTKVAECGSAFPPPASPCSAEAPGCRTASNLHIHIMSKDMHTYTVRSVDHCSGSDRSCSWDDTVRNNYISCQIGWFRCNPIIGYSKVTVVLKAYLQWAVRCTCTGGAESREHEARTGAGLQEEGDAARCHRSSHRCAT